MEKETRFETSPYGSFTHDFMVDEAVNSGEQSSFFLPVELVHQMAFFSHFNPTHVAQ